MDIYQMVTSNLISPVVLAFFLGAVATMVRSDLEFPEQIYSGLSIYLLMAIGLKGGVALNSSGVEVLWKPALGCLGMGIAIPCWCYLILKKLGRFNTSDASAIAAHYGSCSVVTFVAATSFLSHMFSEGKLSHEVEGYMPSLVAVLEVPAIVVALMIARVQEKSGGTWGSILHEVFAGRSVLLLIGGMLIGWAVGKDGFTRVAPLFEGPFQGFLVLFMLELGMVAAKRFGDLRKVGIFLLFFGMLMPVVHAAVGLWIGKFTGLSLGGATTLAVLAASASYIAAPAAVRVGLPNANPGYYLTSSLAITFPFNLAIGIPLYFQMAVWLYG